MSLVKLVRKTKRGASTVVWPALQKLVDLAAAANIPVCGGAFGVASHVIGMINSVRDSKLQCYELLATLDESCAMIDRFTRAMDPKYIECSNDPTAEIARQAIERLQDDLKEVLLIVEEELDQQLWRRLLRSSYITEEIARCKERLERSDTRFRTDISFVTAGNVRRLGYGVPYDEFRIMGAKALRHDAVGEMEPIPLLEGEGFMHTEVDGKRRVVRQFHREEDFLWELKFLQRHAGPHFQVYGYSQDSNPPFVVYHTASLVPFKYYWWCEYINPTLGTVDLWAKWLTRTFQGVDAFDFVLRRSPTVFTQADIPTIASIIENAKIDDKGRAKLSIPAVQQNASTPFDTLSRKDIARLVFASAKPVSSYEDFFGDAVYEPDLVRNEYLQDERQLVSWLGRPQLLFRRKRQHTRAFWIPGDVLTLDREASKRKLELTCRYADHLTVRQRWTLEEPKTVSGISTFDVLAIGDGAFRCAVIGPQSQMSTVALSLKGSADLDGEALYEAALHTRRLKDKYCIINREVFVCVEVFATISVDLSSPSPTKGSESTYLYVSVEDGSVRTYWSTAEEMNDETMSDAERNKAEMRWPTVSVRHPSSKLAHLEDDEIAEAVKYFEHHGIRHWDATNSPGGIPSRLPRLSAAST